MDYVVLYLFSDLVCFICIFRDIFSARMGIECLIFNKNDYRSSNSDIVPDTNGFYELNSGFLPTQSVFKQRTNIKIETQPDYNNTNNDNNDIDREWNEYLRIEHENLMQNVLYFKSVNAAIPAINPSNKHSLEMTLILQLKLWIDHYGLPALINGNNQIHQMQRLQTAFTKAKEEADELDEETTQLTQQVFTLENDVVELKKRYTMKCNQLKMFQVDNNPNLIGLPCQPYKNRNKDKQTRLKIKITQSKSINETSKSYQDIKNEVVRLRKLCQLKTGEYNRAKQQLFKKSMNSISTQIAPHIVVNDDHDIPKSLPLNELWKSYIHQISATPQTQNTCISNLIDVPSIITDDEYSLLFKVMVNDIGLYQDFPFENKLPAAMRNNKYVLKKDGLIYGKYISPNVVKLENGLFCSTRDLKLHDDLKNIKTKGANGNLLAIKPVMSDIKSYKDIENEVMRGVNLPNFRVKASISSGISNKSSDFAQINMPNKSGTPNDYDEYDSDDDDNDHILLKVIVDKIVVYSDIQLKHEIKHNTLKKNSLFYGKYINSNVIKFIQKGWYCSVMDVKEPIKKKPALHPNTIFLPFNEEKEQNGNEHKQSTLTHKKSKSPDNYNVFVDDSYSRQGNKQHETGLHLLTLPSLHSTNSQSDSKSTKLLKNDASISLF